MKVPGVRIDRASFLRRELHLFFPEEKVSEAIRFNPARAGIPKEKINGIAQGVINQESTVVSGFSVFSLNDSRNAAPFSGSGIPAVIFYFFFDIRRTV